MISAKIVGINPPKGRAIAITEEGEYVLLEIARGDEFEMYDEIIANFDFYPLGYVRVKKIITDEIVDLYIQDYCNKEHAQRYLRDLRQLL